MAVSVLLALPIEGIMLNSVAEGHVWADVLLPPPVVSSFHMLRNNLMQKN